MKKRLISIIGIILTIVMSVTIFAGCTNDQPQDNTSANGTTDAKETTEKKRENYKFLFATTITDPVEQEDNIIEEELEKRFPDIDFEALGLERQSYETQLTTMIAGGDIPDMWNISGRGSLEMFVRQGTVAEFKLSDFKKWAPGIFQAYYLDDPDQAPGLLFSLVDGKHYGISTMNNNRIAKGAAWRTDWLENVGITEIPRTIEEFEEAFKRFTENDPDKNGQDDTYGMTGFLNFGFSEFFGAFGTLSYTFVLDKDGSIALGSIMDESKEALALLRDWYQKGYIDPEFIVDNDATMRQKWGNGKVGYASHTWYRFSPPEWYMNGSYYTALMSVNPDAKYELAYPPVGPNGDSGNCQWGSLSNGRVFGIQNEENPARFERLLNVLDEIHGDTELNALTQFGIKDLHWEFKDGVVTYIPPYDNKSDQAEIGLNLYNWIASNGNNPYFKNVKPEWIERTNSGAMKHGYDYFPDLVVLMPEGDERQLNKFLKDITKKWFVEFIVGERPLDDFETFRQELLDAGAEQLIKNANETYLKWDEAMAAINAEVAK